MNALIGTISDQHELLHVPLISLISWYATERLTDRPRFRISWLEFKNMNGKYCCWTWHNESTKILVNQEHNWNNLVLLIFPFFSFFLIFPFLYSQFSKFSYTLTKLKVHHLKYKPVWREWGTFYAFHIIYVYLSKVAEYTLTILLFPFINKSVH